jgi:hypothetical protein
MDFGTLNQTYDHMSIPLLDAYITQLEGLKTEVQKGAADWQRRRDSSQTQASAINEMKSLRAADANLPYAQNFAPDMILWIERSLALAERTMNQMQRIRGALQAEAKSDKK